MNVTYNLISSVPNRAIAGTIILSAYQGSALIGTTTTAAGQSAVTLALSRAGRYEMRINYSPDDGSMPWAIYQEYLDVGSSNLTRYAPMRPMLLWTPNAARAFVEYEAARAIELRQGNFIMGGFALGSSGLQLRVGHGECIIAGRLFTQPVGEYLYSEPLPKNASGIAVFLVAQDAMFNTQMAGLRLIWKFDELPVRNGIMLYRGIRTDNSGYVSGSASPKLYGESIGDKVAFYPGAGPGGTYYCTADIECSTNSTTEVLVKQFKAGHFGTYRISCEIRRDTSLSTVYANVYVDNEGSPRVQWSHNTNTYAAKTGELRLFQGQIVSIKFRTSSASYAAWIRYAALDSGISEPWAPAVVCC